MATNDRINTPDPNDKGCYPYEDIQEAHDDLRSGDYPEKPKTTTTEKLMKPQGPNPNED